MAQITIKVKRVASLLKYLRRGRGLEDYQGGVTLILRIPGASPVPVGSLPLMRGGSQVTIDIPPEYYGRRIIVHGATPNERDLLFKLDTTFIITEDGNWIVEQFPGDRGPVRKVDSLTIALVDDWTDLLRRMQQDLEEEDQDRRALITLLKGLDLVSLDETFWQTIFAIPSPSFRGNAMLEIVNSDHATARLTFRPDRIEVELDMRKPGGGRFGRARFDYFLRPVRNESEVRIFADQPDSRFTSIGVWEADPLTIDFSRPGLNSVSGSNQAALSELFSDLFSESEAFIRTGLGDNLAAIQDAWPALRDIATPARRSLLPDALTIYRAGIKATVRKKISPFAGQEQWFDVRCYRPRLVSAIETLVVEPGPLNTDRRRGI